MGPFGSKIKAENFVRAGVPVIKGGNLGGTYLSETSFDFLTQEKASELASSKAGRLDIVVTHRGTLGQVGLIPESSKYEQYVVSQSQLKMSFDTEKVDPYYVYYFLRSPLGQSRLLANTSQVGVPAIAQALTTIRQLQIPLPPRDSQTEITATLRALDDRISLLRETNATLEAIAQALFKSWFVDFDPVRAKMEGRAPEGMDEATAALFPDSFEETELGVVPRGWKIGKLASLMRLHKGSVNPGALPHAEFQHFSLPAFDAGQMPIQELGGAIKSNKTSVPEDAVLVSKLNPHIPRVWLPSTVGQNAVCSTEFLPFVPAGPSTTAFVYSLLAAPDFSKALSQLVTGTSNSHQRVKPNGVLSMPGVIPPVEVVASFDFAANGLLARLKANRQQAQTLSTLRDTLLPRLISGQLRLPEAHALIESAAV